MTLTQTLREALEYISRIIAPDSKIVSARTKARNKAFDALAALSRHETELPEKVGEAVKNCLQIINSKNEDGTFAFEHRDMAEDIETLVEAASEESDAERAVALKEFDDAVNQVLGDEEFEPLSAYEICLEGKTINKIRAALKGRG